MNHNSIDIFQSKSQESSRHQSFRVVTQSPGTDSTCQRVSWRHLRTQRRVRRRACRRDGSTRRIRSSYSGTHGVGKLEDSKQTSSTSNCSIQTGLLIHSSFPIHDLRWSLTTSSKDTPFWYYLVNRHMNPVTSSVSNWNRTWRPVKRTPDPLCRTKGPSSPALPQPFSKLKPLTAYVIPDGQSLSEEWKRQNHRKRKTPLKVPHYPSVPSPSSETGVVGARVSSSCCSYSTVSGRHVRPNTSKSTNDFLATVRTTVLQSRQSSHFRSLPKTIVVPRRASILSGHNPKGPEIDPKEK